MTTTRPHLEYLSLEIWKGLAGNGRIQRTGHVIQHLYVLKDHRNANKFSTSCLILIATDSMRSSQRQGQIKSIYVAPA